MTEETLAEKARRRLLESGHATPEPAAPKVWDDELIPDDDDASRPRSAEDEALDRAIDGIDILEAYRRWCGKMEPKVGSKRESIMVSCPNPAHPDAHPSAWVNLDSGLWNCGACGIGGDRYTIAGFRYGLDPRTEFPELRRRIGQELGFTFIRTAGGSEFIEPPLEDEPPRLASVTTLELEEPDDTDWSNAPGIDWRSLLPGDTFMSRWMEITCEDDLPEEYYFWLGLMAVGFAGGNDVMLMDYEPVRPNLYLCLFGPSGGGKSRSTKPFTRLLREALPYDYDDPDSIGTYQVPVPQSAEALIDSFSKEELDAAGAHVRYAGVRGLVYFKEMSALSGVAGRSGSTLEPTLMDMYDEFEQIETLARTSGRRVAQNFFCSALTTTQPNAIRAILTRTDAESGYLNRWVFATGKPKTPIAYGRERIDVSPCVPMLKNLLAWSSRGRELRLQGGALETWNTFFYDVIAPTKQSDESSLVARCDLYLKKIITILCIDRQLSTPTAEVVEHAVALWPYLRGTYTLLDSKLGRSPFDEMRDWIRDYVRRTEAKGKEATSREIGRCIPKRFKTELIPKVLEHMTKLGELQEFVQPRPEGSRGPRKTIYSYVG